MNKKDRQTGEQTGMILGTFVAFGIIWVIDNIISLLEYLRMEPTSVFYAGGVTFSIVFLLLRYAIKGFTISCFNIGVTAGRKGDKI